MLEDNKKLTVASAIVELMREDLIYGVFDLKMEIDIRKISYDSNDVQNGTLFICKGINFKEEYLQSAILKGATVYISEVRYKVDIPCILVSDIRKALAVLSKWYYGNADEKLNLCGITGTKGKSTTVYFLYNILDEAKKKVGFSTTVDTFDGSIVKESVLTTPESLEAHKLFNGAVRNGCTDFIMEVSSQAYKMDRIFGLHYKYGIFVNISDDHISPNEHKDFDEYFGCKLEIVRGFENAVINKDDEKSAEVFEAAKNAKRVMSYSILSEDADVYAKNIRKSGFKTTFDLVVEGKTLEGEINIAGVFNVSNALSAVAVAHMMGIDEGAILRGIAKTRVCGRMDIYENDGYTAIVDYAHNKESLAHAASALSEYFPEKKFTIVFGCPGGKALQRRRDMAVESAKVASYVYVTSEDPSREDPLAIANEITSYLDELNVKSEIVVDRETAIKKAIEEMKKDELVFIAGKGSEHYQLINGVAKPYPSDTALAKKFIMQKTEVDS